MKGGEKERSQGERTNGGVSHPNFTKINERRTTICKSSTDWGKCM